MKSMICRKCGNTREIGRLLCRSCYLEEKRNRAKANFIKNGRYMYRAICKICKKPYISHNKRGKFCSECWTRISSTDTVASNNYETAGGGGYCWKHRRIAETILNRKLTFAEVVHHIDGNPKNNALDNLIVMPRDKHASLHYYLRQQKVIFEKARNDNPTNCWDTIMVHITTKWIETMGITVIKLWEIK